MKDKLLVLNSGSSSLKFSVFKSQEDSDCSLEMQAEFSLQSIGWCLTSKYIQDKIILPADTSLADLAQNALKILLKSYGSLTDFIGAGHRVVHGGNKFNQAVIIDDQIITDLEALIPLAPLHQPGSLAVIKAVRQSYPQLLQVACFDSAFHFNQNELNKIIAIPEKFRKLGIQNYGFHGLSYDYVSSFLETKLAHIKLKKVVVAHLGSGSSLCALKDYKSQATTMGFSALNGLLMGTRPGNLDSAVILHMIESLGLSAKEIQQILYKQSGLLALSGKTSNMKELLECDDTKSKLAVAMYVHRAVREIGSLVAELEGIDAIVFTGGIGENAAPIREAICKKLIWMGLLIDAGLNVQRVEQGSYRQISTVESAVKAFVIPTDENLVIARQLAGLCKV